jgi:hypothetical protein
MFIPDPNFSIPDPGFKKSLDPGSGSPSKSFKYFYEIWSGMFIRDVHPGSRTPDPDLDFLPIKDPGSGGQKRHRIPDPLAKKAPDPGSRGQKGTGSRIRILHTAFYIVRRIIFEALFTKLYSASRFKKTKVKSLCFFWWVGVFPQFDLRWKAFEQIRKGASFFRCYAEALNSTFKGTVQRDGSGRN